MKQIINRFSILTIALFFAVIGSNVFAQNNLIKVADGRDSNENQKPTEIETVFVKKEVRAHEQAIKNLAKSRDFKCDEDDTKEYLSNADGLANLTVEAVLEGSFTKPKSSQKAFFYQICWSAGGKYATALGGIMVVEKQKVVSHFVYASVSGFNDFRVLPDINRNGLSEVVSGYASRVDELMFTNAIMVFEIGTDKITNLGATDTFDRTADGDTAYKILVKTGNTPWFYCESYASEPNSEKSNWQIKASLKQCLLNREKSKDGFGFVKLPVAVKKREK